MNIVYHQRFLKSYRKRIKPYPSKDSRYEQRLKLFLETPHHPILKDHALVGDLQGYRSFSITGDIRVVYKRENETIYFYDIGAHNQVYS